MKAFTFLLVLIMGMGIGIYVSEKQLVPSGIQNLIGKKQEIQQASTEAQTTASEQKQDTAKTDPLPPQDTTPTEVYRNDAYKLTFSYPGKGYMAEKDFDTFCGVKGTDGILRNEPVHIAKGTTIPLTFRADPINDTSAAGPVFLGGVGLNYDAKCYPFSIVNLVVVKKTPKFSMLKFIDLATKAANGTASSGSTGGGARNSTTTMNGKQVPFIETTDGSAMMNKSVTYYFEGTDYIYELSYNYSEIALESEQELSQQAARDYAIATAVVQNFDFQ